MTVLTLLCALCLAGGVQDPVKVTASLTASRISVGGSTTLQISVETPGDAPDDIRVPALAPELEVMGTGDFSQTQISIPGGRSRVTRRDVILVATRPGAFRIPPVTVRVKGRVYHTAPLELTVVDAPAMPRGGDAFVTGAPRLTLWLEPDTVYVGEQVLLEAEAVFSDEMRLRQTRPASFDPPAPSGFWVQDLPNPVTVSLRVLDGRTVEMQTFRRAYFPLAPGVFVFPPARLHYELRRGFLYAPESRQIESDSARLVVLPLPEVGRPASFGGAVGSLSLRAALAPQRVNLGDATTLVLELEGIGNVKALPEPKLPELSGIQIFSPAQDSRVDVNDDRVSGSKRFRWVLVPERPGTVVIPPIEYAYFDPAERKYQILRTDSLMLETVPIVATALGDTALRPIRIHARGPRLGWIRTPGFVLLNSMPLVALMLVVAVRRRRERGPTQKQVRARVLAQIDALRQQPADAAFLSDLEHMLERGIREIVDGSGDAAAQLRSVGASSVADRLETLIAELRRLRFAPAERFDRDTLVQTVLALLHDVPVSRRRRGAAAVVLTFVLAGAAAGAATVRASSAEWEQGIASFHDGDYVRAANFFHAYALTQPRDADAWYNHGIAAYRAGDAGRAVWAWLRAARLAPRDRDIAHNLELAGATGALAAVRPFDRLAPNERWLLATIAWWLFAAAIALRILRRSRAGWLAIPALVLGVVVIAGAAAAAFRPVHVTPLRGGTELLAAPHAHAESLGRFEPGSIGRVRGRRIAYVLIAVDDVREAWVERGAVAAP